MKTKTLVIGGLVALGAAGLLYWLLKKQSTSTVVGAPAPGLGTGLDQWQGIAGLINAGSSAVSGISDSVRKWFQGNDDQKVNENAGYTPTLTGADVTLKMPK